MPANLQVFISHASRDKGAVLRVERTLRQQGLHPWVDRQALTGGQRWASELQSAVEGSAALVLVVTPAALASPMVCQEYTTALAHAIPIVLLLLRPVPQLPAELSHLPAINWKRAGWRSEQQLFIALYDLGIRPVEDRMTLGTQWLENVMLSNAGLAPQRWKRYTVAHGAYVAMAIGYGTLVLATLSLFVSTPFVFSQLLGVEGVLAASPAAGVLEAFAPLVVIFALMLILWMLAIPFVAFLAYMFAWWTPEVVIVADESFTVSLFRFRWGRAGVEPAHFSFAAISHLTVRRAPFGGAVVTVARPGHSVPVRLPARLGHTMAIAAVIGEAWQAYSQQQREAPPAVGADDLPGDPARAASTTKAVHEPGDARAPRYVIIAGPGDQRLLASLASQLVWRGLTLAECVQLPPPESLTIPSAVGAARAGFALVVLSARVLRFARLEPLVRDLLDRGVLVIPIVVSGRLDKPTFVAHLQWVDFSQRSAFRYAVSNLLNALEAAGIPLSAPPDAVDGELILALASHGRSLPDWCVFRAHFQTQTVYRLYRFSRMSWLRRWLALISLFCASIALLALVISGALIVSQEDGLRMTVNAGILPTLLACLAGLAALVVVSVRSLRRHPSGPNAYSQLIHNTAIPEMIVVTPNALVVHLANVRTSHFEDYVLALDDIQRIERRRAYYTPIRLRLTRRNGHAVEFGLPGTLVDVDVAAATIEQQWRDVHERAVAK